VAGIVLLSLHHEQYLPHLPLWLTATVISRDVLLLLGLVVIHFICGKVTVKPHLIGKGATVLQMVAVCWALLKLPASGLHWFALSAAVCTGVSGLIYVSDGVRQLSASPASSPTPKQ
jgi:cardiolipin synthase